MSTAGSLRFLQREDNYRRQNGDRPITRRQQRQMDRQIDRVDRRRSPILLDEAAAFRGPVTLPDMGATDPHSRMMIHFGYALAEKGKHIYAGTVSTATRAHRRAANKAARIARRARRR